MNKKWFEAKKDILLADSFVRQDVKFNESVGYVFVQPKFLAERIFFFCKFLIHVIVSSIDSICPK